MMQGGPTNQQAYDRGTTIFSPNGRIYQVEYAREAVKQGAPVVGVAEDAGLVLAATISTRSPLVETDSVEKLYTVDDHLVIGGSGHAADTRRLVDLARERAQEERLRYDEPITAEMLATAIADHLHEHTQAGVARPYGSGLFIGGYDDAPQLFEVDPSGSIRAWRANAIGQESETAVEHLEDEYDVSQPPEDALPLAVAGLGTSVAELEADAVAAVRIGPNGYRFLSEQTIQTAFEQQN